MLGNTQPNKPISSTPRKSGRGRAFLFNALGLIIILAIVIFGGYSSGISVRNQTRSSTLLQELGQQYQLALVDMQFGRYENAKQRLEYIIQNDPSFPGVQDTLTQLLVQMNTKATSLPTVTSTPVVTPTLDFTGVEEAFTKAQQLIAAKDWPGTIAALDEARKFNWQYNTSQVDGMYYFALRNYGYDLIVKQGNLEGGIYQLTLAERFGQLDRDANGIREGARYYILGASFWELNWEQALFYFDQVYRGWSGLWDGTMTASERYRIASMRYGDELLAKKDCENAIINYENAQRISQLDQTASANYASAIADCQPAATSTQGLETPTPGGPTATPKNTKPAAETPTDIPPTDTPTDIPPTDIPTDTPTP